jgi:hypothetical protein
VSGGGLGGRGGGFLERFGVHGERDGLGGRLGPQVVHPCFQPFLPRVEVHGSEDWERWLSNEYLRASLVQQRWIFEGIG